MRFAGETGGNFGPQKFFEKSAGLVKGYDASWRER